MEGRPVNAKTAATPLRAKPLFRFDAVSYSETLCGLGIKSLL
jgi:hypothetical protein